MSNYFSQFIEKVNRLKFPITIEPLILLYTVSVGLNEVIRSNLIISKICLRKLNYNSTICDNLSDDENEQYEDEVQEHVTNYESLYNSCAFVPRILYGLLAGTWSDRNGRKPLLVLPVIGQLLASLSYAFNYYFLTQLPWQLISLEFLNELTGTYVVYYMAEYTFITDITSEDSRTYRLSIVDGMDYMSTSIGTLISGPIFLYGGYYAVFGSSAGACVLALLILAFWVKESLPKPEDSKEGCSLSQENSFPNYGSNATLENKDTENERENKPDNIKMDENRNFIVSGFHYAIESLRTVFKSRRFPEKPILFLSIFNFACFIFAYNGTEGTHRYLFAQKKYEWDEQNFTKYLFRYRIAYMITLWVVSPVLTRLLNVSDVMLNIIACLISSAGYMIPALTSGAEWFTVGSFVCMLFPLTTITARSILSSVIPAHEIGRVFSVLALFSATSGSLVEALFQKVYSESIGHFLGAYLFLNSGLLLITIPSSITIYILLKKMKTRDQE